MNKQDVNGKPLYEVEPIKDLKEMTNYAVEAFSERTAFLTKPVKREPYLPISFKEFGHDIDAFASKILELGAVKDKRIAIVAETRYEWYVSYLSVMNGLSIVVPIDKELSVKEIRSMLERAKVSVVIYSNSLRDKVLQAVKGLKEVEALILMDHYKNEVEPFITNEISSELPLEYSWEHLRAEGEKLLKEGYREFLDCDIDPEEMRILLFTSGTTARSKAVMHSHKSICTNLMAMSSMLYVGGDVTLSVLPLHHTYECTCGFLCQVYRGNTVAELEGLRYIVDNLKESKTSLMLAVPLILESFHKKIWQSIEKQGKKEKVEFALKLSRALRKIGIDLRKKLFKDIHEALGGHMRLLIAGGAAINPKVLQDFNDFGILAVQGYGLTECGPILALNRDNSYRNESAGLPLPGTIAEVYQPDEDGIGEFRSRGDNVMLGYYEDPELTAETLRDGWFYTGDYGYMTKDNFLVITGRKKNVIVTKNGKNVFPEELEVLLNNNPEIEESVVSTEPDRKDDQLLIVEVYPDEVAVQERLEKKDVSQDETHELISSLVQELNAGQPIYKRIKKVYLRDEPFEKNTSQKIIRKYAD